MGSLPRCRTMQRALRRGPRQDKDRLQGLKDREFEGGAIGLERLDTAEGMRSDFAALVGSRRLLRCR